MRPLRERGASRGVERSEPAMSLRHVVPLLTFLTLSVPVSAHAQELTRAVRERCITSVARIEVDTPNGTVSYPAPAMIVIGEKRNYGAVPGIGDHHELPKAQPVRKSS